MRGFTDKALVLLSNLHTFEESGSIYKYDYQIAVSNLVGYLNSVGIEHHCLITDSLATRIGMHNPKWLATGAPEDIFFMHNYCSVPSYTLTPPCDEVLGRVRKKFPIERGLSPKERFSIVSKRVRYVEKEIISSYSLVAVFGKEFPVKSQPGDGRAVLRINDKKFYTTMELSGEVVPINSFMQVPYANLCLNEWRPYSG